MTESTNVNKVEAFKRRQHKEEMKRQVISFALMIIATLIAFAVVATESIRMFAIPVLVILALIQVAFQFYYFMHMKDKGHEMPAVMIYGGVWAALLTLAGLGIISWW